VLVCGNPEHLSIRREGETGVLPVGLSSHGRIGHDAARERKGGGELLEIREDIPHDILMIPRFFMQEMLYKGDMTLVYLLITLGIFALLAYIVLGGWPGIVGLL
jgi:hypothetical protein